MKIGFWKNLLQILEKQLPCFSQNGVHLNISNHQKKYLMTPSNCNEWRRDGLILQSPFIPEKNAASSKELCDVIRHPLQQKLALTDSTENLDHLSRWTHAAHGNSHCWLNPFDRLHLPQFPASSSPFATLQNGQLPGGR